MIAKDEINNDPLQRQTGTGREDLEPRTVPPPSGDSPVSERSSVLRRYRWWIVPVVIIAAVLGWRAFSGSRQAMGFEQQQATPVRAAEVTRGNLKLRSTFPGEIVGEISDIAPEVSGILREIPVRIGDHITKGQLLAVIDDVNLRNQTLEARGQYGVAQANEKRAEAELDSAIAEHHRASELHAQNLLSDQEFERVTSQLATNRANVAASEAQSEQASARLALLEQQLADSRVTAPFSGVIADRYVDRGTLVQPGTKIVRIVQDESLRVQFRVPERDLGLVRVGVPFASTTVATGPRIWHGTVERVSGEVSRSDRTALVEGELEETNEVLKPGMYAEVRVELREINNALLVPSTAVVDRVATDGTQSTGVFVASMAEESPTDSADERIATATWVDVDALGNSEGQTAIEGYLAEGDLVLTMGHNDLRDQASVRVVQIEQRTSLELLPSKTNFAATGAVP